MDEVEYDDVHRTAFTFGGLPVDPDHVHCLAKKVKDRVTGNVRHWARRCTSGPQAGNLYDPQTVERHELVRQDNGRLRYELTAVSENSFNAYVAFLKTGNAARLRIAQRGE